MKNEYFLLAEFKKRFDLGYFAYFYFILFKKCVCYFVMQIVNDFFMFFFSGSSNP